MQRLIELIEQQPGVSRCAPVRHIATIEDDYVEAGGGKMPRGERPADPRANDRDVASGIFG
jgi:hypothetical protein